MFDSYDEFYYNFEQDIVDLPRGDMGLYENIIEHFDKLSIKYTPLNEGVFGYFDAYTNSIFLDKVHGINNHIFFHELAHFFDENFLYNNSRLDDIIPSKIQQHTRAEFIAELSSSLTQAKYNLQNIPIKASLQYLALEYEVDYENFRPLNERASKRELLYVALDDSIQMRISYIINEFDKILPVYLTN